MKDAFEHNFKHCLENFEMPYNSAAWEAMQARLDATPPSFEDQMKDGLNATEYPYNPAAWTEMSKRLDGKTKGGATKWFVAAGIIGATIITSLFLWNTTTEDDSPSVSLKVATPENKNTASTENTVKAKSPQVMPETMEIVNGTPSNASDRELQTEQGNPDSQNGSVSNVDAGGNSDQNGQHTSTNDTSLPEPKTAEPSKNDVAGTKAIHYIAPAIPENMCEGNAIQIENQNDFPIMIVYPNGLNWIGREHRVTKLNPSLAGLYTVGYVLDNIFFQKSNFVVNAAPNSDFDFVDLSKKYLNGLPTIEVRSTTQAEHYVWTYENGTVHGIDVGLHFYEKGLYPVTLTVTDENGCSSEVEKQINVDEDYNLMAMTGFYPTGNDRTTNSFMPYALTERNVNFTLIIVDPNDGHVLYQTSDASQGWNGIDQQTGSLVPLNKNYIWKVTVMNPEPGEKNVYAGSITALNP